MRKLDRLSPEQAEVGIVSKIRIMSQNRSISWVTIMNGDKEIIGRAVFVVSFGCPVG